MKFITRIGILWDLYKVFIDAKIAYFVTGLNWWNRVSTIKSNGSKFSESLKKERQESR